jgi:hypothetical protein
LSLSDVSLNNGGQAVWAQSSGVNPGIYRYNAATNTSSLYANGPGSTPGTAVYTAPQINDAGQVGYRYQTATSAPRQFVSYDPATNTYATHAAEGTGNNAFLFSPAFNNARQIAGKVLLATGPASDPNEIRLWNPNGSFQLIAQDNGALLASPYDRFFNSVGVNDVGQVAFIASLTAAAGGGQGVFLSDGLTTFTITTSLTSLVGSIESFAPAVNNAGLVVFRARDDAGKYALWAGGGTSSDPLRRIITEGDTVTTDQGLAVIGGLGGELPFGGAPSLNEAGQIAFVASLLSATAPGVRLGNAVFVASPQTAAQVIPEPGTGALLALAAALPPLVAAMRRRRSARPLRSERG